MPSWFLHKPTRTTTFLRLPSAQGELGPAESTELSHHQGSSRFLSVSLRRRPLREDMRPWLLRRLGDERMRALPPGLWSLHRRWRQPVQPLPRRTPAAARDVCGPRPGPDPRRLREWYVPPERARRCLAALSASLFNPCFWDVRRMKAGQWSSSLEWESSSAPFDGQGRRVKEAVTGI